MKIKKIISVLTACMLLSGCGAVQEEPAQKLVSEIPAQSVSVTDSDQNFHDSQMQFALKLFQQNVTENPEQNILVSPLSVMLALSMTANGAENQTRSEMEQVLGSPLSDLNQDLYSYIQKLPSSENAKLSIANSVWFRDRENFTVNADFLQKNETYYQADIYQEAFDQKTCDQINNWVDEKTDHMISKIINEIDSNTMMYLINALAFDAEWQHIYEETDIREGRAFKNISGVKQTVTMMHSSEYNYLESEQATGFLKFYQDGYSFAAILPDESIPIDEYISNLTAEDLSAMLKNVQNTEVSAEMPKFKSEYDTSLVNTLRNMGMQNAFTESADFSGISSDTYLYISDVLHKTFIQVDERGTKAGAVTAVAMERNGLSVEHEPKFVILDRPFVYMIIDNANQLPVFIGTLKEIQD
ncbi:MAG: serpin family protein [Oscillospiraceae bacterium]|nr:serpin family protein [Oscillospiraceae bacterium]